MNGCGSGGSGSGSDTGESVSEDVSMSVGQLYTVYTGNKIIKNEDKTIIQVTHIDTENKSTVMLLEGNATIIRKP